MSFYRPKRHKKIPQANIRLIKKSPEVSIPASSGNYNLLNYIPTLQSYPHTALPITTVHYAIT